MIEVSSSGTILMLEFHFTKREVDKARTSQ